MIFGQLLQEMATALAQVRGVRAVTLGGSRARGTHHAGSDVDLGLYYDAQRLDIEALSVVAQRFNDAGQVGLAGPGEWGPWVDGGGWLVVNGTPVDWILRDLDRVRVQCDRAKAGEFAFHAQPGHPLGFLDISYAGEVASGVTLADPGGVIDDLRAQLQPYPPALQAAFIANLWQATFLLEAARKGLPKNDSAYVMLCCTTALMVCAHAWHAAAGSWPTNEKGLIVDVARLNRDSVDSVESVEGVDAFDFAGQAGKALQWNGDEPALAGVIAQVSQAVQETRAKLEPSQSPRAGASDESSVGPTSESTG